METMLVLYVAIGLLLILVATPLIRKKIKPNHFYGFRVPQTSTTPTCGTPPTPMRAYACW